MKLLLRTTVIYALTLYLLSQVLTGLKIPGDILMLLLSSFVLTLMYLILRPIINIISLPLNLATFGLFSFVTNILILYLLTVFVPDVIITPFTLHSFSLAGITIPTTHFGLFGAYAIVGIMIALLSNFFRWIVK